MCPALGLVPGAQGKGTEPVPGLMGTQRAGAALTAALMAAGPHSHPETRRSLAQDYLGDWQAFFLIEGFGFLLDVG